MLAVDRKSSEVGKQRRRDTFGRLLHCCCICGKLDRWGDGWSYYGSFQELEDGIPVAKFCSKACANKGGPAAENVTDEMKSIAKAAEWREPTIAYREMTDREKYQAVADAQRRSRPSPL